MMPLQRLRADMLDRGVQAFYVRDTSNIRWLTGFDGVFDSEQAHALVVTADQAVLHTDSRYVAACRREAQKTGNVVIDDTRASHAKVAAGLLAGKACSMGIESSISLAEYRALQGAFPEDVELAETSGVVVGLRGVKSAAEIERMKAAQAITDAAFAHIVGFMKPGMTERQVQLELEEFMLRYGAEALAFSSIVATGANGASPHAIPGETVLEAGQCVVLDFGAKAQGYCSDMTRCVFLGQPDQELQRAYNAIRRANEEVEALIKPGVTGIEMHNHAEAVLEQEGFGGCMGHGLGHGVGLDIHEEPCLNLRNDAPLQPGNVVTVEPGVYIFDKFGMRLEDFGVVTENGFQVFTQSTHDMVVI